MGSNIIELAKLGHERAAELKCSYEAINACSLAQLISDLATQLEVQHVRSTNMAVQLANAESKCRELAGESDKTSERMQQLIQIINNADNDYCMCGDAMKNHTHGGCGNPTGMFDYHYNQWLHAENKTPATDDFLAEVRASTIPEGYVLAPQQIFLDPSDIESICSQCGDGHESGYGDFTDGLLWVGNIQRDDGSIVHGLHISSADYSEEGGVTICEFAAQLRQEAAK